MQRFYELREFIPKKIYTSFVLDNEDNNLISEWLTSNAGMKIAISIPQRGEMKALTDRADENAKQLLLHKRAEDDKNSDFLASIGSFLQLEVLPERIEAYDISNNGSDNITCGMVVIEKGVFAKKKYRSFNIKSLSAPDDYASLREALTRRFSHSPDEQGWEYPDLILMDGGLGQVSVAKSVLNEYGIDIPVFGMIKDEHHKTRTLTDGDGEISLNKRQDIFVFIYKIQEEVHRYSLSRMDFQRRKTVKTSTLTNIKGVGKEKANQLLLHFGSFIALKNASIDEIATVKGINKNLATEIYNYLRNNK